VSTRAAAAAPGPPHGGAIDSARRAELALWGIVGLALAGIAGAALQGAQQVVLLAVCVIPLVVVAFQRTLLSWQTLLGAILIVILFIPIRRYTVAAGAPIELEPYRILIAFVLGCWFLGLAADPNVRWQPTGYAAPIALLWLGVLGSLVLNLGRVNASSDLVIKQVTFFGSYFLVLCFVASVIRPGLQLDRMIKLLVGGAAILACCALYEWRGGETLFNGFGRFLPFLHYEDTGGFMTRGTGTRALGSAQHPIALGAALIMLLPLAVYLFKRTGKTIWLAAGALLTLGALATGSRTAVVMMIVVFGCFLWLKREDFIRLVPLMLVLLVVIQAVMPGTLGSFKFMLNPSYLIEEQSGGDGSGTGRLADLGPSLSEWAHGNPFFGQGFGTRAPYQEASGTGAQILDDQWLTTLLELGAIGTVALMWLFCRAIRRLARRARSETGTDSWLAACLCASLLAWTLGLFTYDAFAFIQVTFIAFVLLGISVVAGRGLSGEPR
jgi:O-antigen ligase